MFGEEENYWFIKSFAKIFGHQSDRLIRYTRSNEVEGTSPDFSFYSFSVNTKQASFPPNDRVRIHFWFSESKWKFLD